MPSRKTVGVQNENSIFAKQKSATKSVSSERIELNYSRNQRVLRRSLNSFRRVFHLQFRVLCFEHNEDNMKMMESRLVLYRASKFPENQQTAIGSRTDGRSLEFSLRIESFDSKKDHKDPAVSRRKGLKSPSALEDYQIGKQTTDRRVSKRQYIESSFQGSLIVLLISGTVLLSQRSRSVLDSPRLEGSPSPEISIYVILKASRCVGYVSKMIKSILNRGYKTCCKLFLVQVLDFHSQVKFNIEFIISYNLASPGNSGKISSDNG